MLPQKASDEIAGDGNIDDLNEHGPMRNMLVELEQLLIHSNIHVSIMLVSLISAGHIVSTQSMCCWLYLVVCSMLSWLVGHAITSNLLLLTSATCFHRVIT